MDQMSPKQESELEMRVHSRSGCHRVASTVMACKAVEAEV
jgi:hypothetical protein